MNTLDVEGWRVSFDRETTVLAYASFDAGHAEQCVCAHCENWRAVRASAHPAAFRCLLDTLGIPFDREAETYESCRLPSGLHLYGGWFHFVGKIESVPAAMTPETESIQFRQFSSSSFGIAFRDRNDLALKSFAGHPVVQLEFWTQVPWVIDAPDPG